MRNDYYVIMFSLPIFIIILEIYVPGFFSWVDSFILCSVLFPLSSGIIHYQLKESITYMCRKYIVETILGLLSFLVPQFPAI